MFELLSNKKKTFKKASLVVHDFVSARKGGKGSS